MTSLFPHPASHIVFTGMLLLLSALSFQRTIVYKDDLTLWTDALNKSPFRARTHNNICSAYIKIDMMGNALKKCLKAVELNPYYAPAHSNLAYIYYQKGMLNDAERELKLATDIYQRMGRPFEDLRRRLGFVFIKKGLIREAMGEFEKSLALIPDHPDAKHKISALYTNEAWSYTDRGDFSRALLLHNIAVSISPDYADAHYGLALSYEALGQKEDAKRHYQEYLRLAPPDEPFRKDAIRHLERLR